MGSDSDSERTSRSRRATLNGISKKQRASRAASKRHRGNKQAKLLAYPKEIDRLEKELAHANEVIRDGQIQMMGM